MLANILGVIGSVLIYVTARPTGLSSFPLVIYYLGVFMITISIIWTTVQIGLAKKRRFMTDIIECALRQIESLGEESCKNLRCNVMVPLRLISKLRLKYTVGHYPRVERWQFWSFNEGCVGRAFQSKKIAWGDLSHLVGAGSWEEVIERTNNESTDLWGLDPSHWKTTSTLASIVSVPLLSNGKVVGVLSVDDTVAPSSSILMCTPERQEAVNGVLTGLAKLITSTYNRL